MKIVSSTEKYAVENNILDAKKPSPYRTDSIIPKRIDLDESATKPIGKANEPADKHFDSDNAVVTRAHFNTVEAANDIPEVDYANTVRALGGPFLL